MIPAKPIQQDRRPALLCYDGSDSARGAIEHAGAVLGGGPAIVLTVWESVGSALLRHPLPGATQLGRDIGEISREVVDELDAGTADRAQATAAEGVGIAENAGFDARVLTQRAIGLFGERSEATVWQGVLGAADDEDAVVVVLGSRGRSWPHGGAARQRVLRSGPQQRTTRADRAFDGIVVEVVT